MGLEADEQRIQKILDALHDGPVRYKHEFAIYQIMDTLQLLIQKPLVFAIIRKGEGIRATFWTCHDPEYQESFDLKIGAVIDGLKRGLRSESYIFELPIPRRSGSELLLYASKICLTPSREVTFPQLDPKDANTLRKLIDAIDRKNELSMEVIKALETPLKVLPPNNRRHTPQYPECDNDLRLSEKSQEKYSDWMRKIVSKALSEATESPILQQEEKNWPNLYCTIRRAVSKKRDNRFPYTVQYVLSHRQREAIISSRGDGRQIAKNIEISLGKECRIVSDSVFNSGITEFSYEPLKVNESSGATRRKAGDELDLARRNAEQEILGTKVVVAGGESLQFFIVPVHVGGVVWATLFTTSPTNSDHIEDRLWTSNYYFYRVLLTQIAERIRVAAKEQYHNCLRTIFGSGMVRFEKGENIETVRETIDNEWAKLTAYFPYAGVSLADLRPIARPGVDKGKFVTLLPFENPHECFEKSLSIDKFGDLDLEALEEDLDLRTERALGAVEQHRLAVRTAAAAIMGRNMSHNIGSHVLARYASELGREDQRASEAAVQRARTIPAENHHGAFLRYLQRRMDFIAEISTAEKSFWSQSLNLGAVLQRLDYDHERERINTGKTNFNPILLSYVSGRADISATVVHSDELDAINFSSPGGEVGVHALYVILENVIRNSARHNASVISPLRVEVDIKPAGDWWKLTIMDRQSALNGQKDLIANINKIIDSALVEDDGKIEHKYWGIREMQICAHYLRHKPMGDLGQKPDEREKLERSEKPDNFPALEAVVCCPGDGRAYLGYCLYLKKPTTCAIVAPRDVLGMAIADRATQIAPGVCVFGDEADVQDLRAYDFVLTVDGLLPLNDRLSRTSLPVRTLAVKRRLIEKLVRRIREDRTDLTRLVELLNNLMWREYKQRREHWGNKRQVDALVAWLERDGNDSRHGRFSHKLKGTDQYRAFANEPPETSKRICLAWVDHAHSTDFESDQLPNLASAYKKTSEDYAAPIVFAETFDKLGPHAAELEEQQSLRSGGNELIAAALARVTILDERVQSEYEHDYRSIPYRILWPCMGVWVPPRDAGLDLNKNPTFDGIQKFLGRPTELEEQLPIDFLVIHLTLLENLRKQCGHESEQKTLELLCAEAQLSERCEIVTISGRGVPSARIGELMKQGEGLRVRYLPVSALLEYLVARPSKLALMRVLWSAAAVS